MFVEDDSFPLLLYESVFGWNIFGQGVHILSLFLDFWNDVPLLGWFAHQRIKKMNVTNSKFWNNSQKNIVAKKRCWSF